jgi:hypothetical protein
LRLSSEGQKYHHQKGNDKAGLYLYLIRPEGRSGSLSMLGQQKSGMVYWANARHLMQSFLLQ